MVSQPNACPCPLTLFPKSHRTHAAFVHSIHPTRLCGPGPAIPYQTSSSLKRALQPLKNEQRKDGGHLQAIQVTGAVMPSWSSPATSAVVQSPRLQGTPILPHSLKQWEELHTQHGAACRAGKNLKETGQLGNPGSWVTF